VHIPDIQKNILDPEKKQGYQCRGQMIKPGKPFLPQKLINHQKRPEKYKSLF
jgi:hypothetical protein